MSSSPLGVRLRGSTTGVLSIPVALGVAAVAGAVAATAASFAGANGAIAVLGTLAGAAVGVRLGLRGAGVALLLAGVATSALNDVRLLPSVTISDALLALALGALAASGPRHSAALAHARPIGLGIAFIALGGLMASLASADPLASAFNVARLVVAAGSVLAALLLWSPGRAGVMTLVGLWVGSAVTTSAWGLLVHQDIAGRAIGLSTHSNHLALAATMALGPALGLAAGYRGWRVLLAIVAVVVLTAGIVASGSRAALLAASVVAGALAFGYPRALLPMTATLCAVAVLGLAGGVDLPGSNAMSRLLGLDGLGAAASDAERWLLIEAALDRLDLAPLVGSGFESALDAHNVYLQVWAGAGLLGLAGMALLAATAARRYLEARTAGMQRRDALATLALGLACGWLGYFTVALFQNALWDRYVWIPAALMVVTWPHLGRPAAR